MCVCVCVCTCVRVFVYLCTYACFMCDSKVRFCGFLYSLHGLNLCVFVGEIIVCVACHKCHHVHTCDNDVHVPCNVL